MRHVGSVAGRELRSLFVSPVAYGVLALFSLLAGIFFVLNVFFFDQQLMIFQQIGRFDLAQTWNLNDNLISEFFGSMLVVLLILVPAVTMGLFTAEKNNGTQELLLTSPLTIWDIVLGKFAAGAAFVSLLVLVVACFPALLFLYGDPELGKTVSGLLALLLTGWVYVAIGAFASSITKSQVVAFFVTLVVLLGLLLLRAISVYGFAGSGGGDDALRWLSTDVHFQALVEGVVDTQDLSYFVFMIGTFLLMTHAAVESVRWR